MLTGMTEAATLVRDARTDADLGVRDLAALAGVSASTVSRIEAGKMDPTVRMLSRLLSAAGEELELRARPTPGPRLAHLVDAWRRGPRGEDRPDWTRLRAFLDHLAMHPEQKAAAILRTPTPSGSALVDNLLAGMAEKVSDDAGLPRPVWTTRVPPLIEPWVTPGTPRMQKAARAETPPQLAARRLTLAANSLWRDPASVGA
jgi:transcriptional regulator with XRE-family HTH domain